MEAIHDMRGSAYSANQLTIQNKKVYYCGNPVSDIRKSTKPLFPSKYIYSIIGRLNFEMGEIALTETDYEKVIKLLQEIN